MADTTVDITDEFSTFQKFLKLVDNGDSTYSVGASLIGGNLVPAVYDYISLSYTGANLTGVIFKIGGSGGAVVGTLTLGYDGSDNLTTITKT